jgi:hypothetical protein
MDKVQKYNSFNENCVSYYFTASVYIYIHTHTHTHRYIYIYIHTYIHTYYQALCEAFSRKACSTMYSVLAVRDYTEPFYFTKIFLFFIVMENESPLSLAYSSGTASIKNLNPVVNWFPVV